jgi:SAM-dependent methyltransferase
MQSCPLCRSTGPRTLSQLPRGALVRCRACTLVYQRPLPIGHAREYYDRVYDDLACGSTLETARRALFDAFFERLGRGDGRRVLDVGCGLGESLLAAEAAGWESVGIESSRQAVAAGRARGLAIHPSTQSLASAVFDLVTLWNVVEFFDDPVAGLSGVSRLLAPGGLIFIRTPNATFHVAMRRLSQTVRRPRPVSRLLSGAYFLNPLCWTPGSLRRLLGVVGFPSVKVTNATLSPGDPYGVLPDGARGAIRVAKATVSMFAAAVATASRDRLLLSSSLEAWATRDDTPAPVSIARRA